MSLRAALLATTLAIIVGASEALVRLALPAFDPSAQLRLVQHGDIMLGPPHSVARQIKNTGDYDVEVLFGPRGFRDARDVALAAPEDVLVVGDSFAFGWGVAQRERFSDLLEASTGQRVWNLGIPGQGIDGYGRLLRHAEQLGSRARRLVIALCMETDVSGRVPNAESPASEPDGAWLSSAKQRLAEHSALYALVTTLVHRSGPLKALAVRAGLIVPNLAEAGVGTHSMPALRAAAEQVAALARGYEAVVLVVPSRGLWLDHDPLGEARIHQGMVHELATRGLRVVDPRPVFVAGGQPLRHHFASDGHWNARGHRVAAQLLGEALRATR